jgi:hypothetical protein
LRRATLVSAALAVGGVGAMLFALPAVANVDNTYVYCGSGVEYAQSSASLSSGLESETSEFSPPQCAATFLHVDYQDGDGSGWKHWHGGWQVNTYSSYTWNANLAYTVIGPVEVLGQHNTCDAGFVNCNGFVDTDATA